MLSAFDSRELQAVVLALKGVNRDLAKDIRQATVQTMSPEWKQLVEENASSARDRAILAKGARIKGGNPPTAVAATSRRRLSGGLVPADHAGAFEFGGDRQVFRSYTRKNPGGSGTHQVKRRTQRQLPPRFPKGRVVYPAFGEIGPRMVSLWVQLTVRKIYDAFEKGA